MQNKKTHIVVGVTDGKKEPEIKVIYIGGDRRKAREIYLSNRSNEDYDFVGMDTLHGFKSRARPSVDAETERRRAKAMATKQEAEVMDSANKAKAAKDALGEAALKAESEELKAREKLDELLQKSGANLEGTDAEDEGDDGAEDGDDADEGTDAEGDEFIDEEDELAQLIADEEDAEKNADA